MLEWLWKLKGEKMLFFTQTPWNFKVGNIENVNGRPYKITRLQKTGNRYLKVWGKKMFKCRYCNNVFHKPEEDTMQGLVLLCPYCHKTL